MIEEYLRRIDCAPYVDKNGNSECGYAEPLYAQKEEIETRLRLQQTSWNEKLLIVETELARIRREYRQIEHDARNAAIDGTREHYAKALFAQDARCRRVERERDEIVNILARIRSALLEGAKRKWSLGEPKRPQPAIAPIPQTSPSYAVGRPPTTSSSPQPNPLGATLEGLLNNGKPHR
jgi:hypothetical protein